jgi:methionyl-tRNA synthetase
VSRSRQRARGWGIGVPDDPGQVVYVWWDALANYVTALDYGAGCVGCEAPAYEQWWTGADERIHVIGKGIVRFHAVYWPALLLSAGLPLPTRIYVHPYLTVDGQKISKSAANGADPASLVSSYGSDALRWWLLHDVPRGSDADFTVDRLVACANEDLANGLGNLASRVAAMVKRFGDGGGSGGDGSSLALDVRDLERVVRSCVDEFDFRSATLAVNSVVAGLNQYIEANRPWELARAGSAGELAGVLGFLLGAVRHVAEVAVPLIPSGAGRVLSLLTAAVEGTDPLAPAFPRIDVEATGVLSPSH